MGEPTWLRRAGRATLADGRVLLWSVAEGRHGRRWRASTRDAGGGLLDDLLLEVAPDGRIGRLELTTSAGQLTFHPEPDEQSAHGNVVGPDGVRHVAVGWSPGRGIEIPSSPIADAVLVHAAPAAAVIPIATIGEDLMPRPGTARLERAGEGVWLLHGRPVRLDRDGVPHLPDGASWPLEDLTVIPE
jgi:hypothetical protein